LLPLYKEAEKENTMAIITRTNTQPTFKKVNFGISELGDEAMIGIGNLPKTLADMANYIQRSPSKIGSDGKERGNKVLPVGEDKYSFEFTMSDGTISTIEVTLTAWLNKEHVKAAESALEREAKEKAEKARFEAELKEREALLANFTPEQIETMNKLAMLGKK
jgi:hypothetical protein